MTARWRLLAVTAAISSGTILVLGAVSPARPEEPASPAPGTRLGERLVVELCAAGLLWCEGAP